ncbi:MAG: TlpA family protein disulfide reductase, partial [Actinomyces sp.]
HRPRPRLAGLAALVAAVALVATACSGTGGDDVLDVQAALDGDPAAVQPDVPADVDIDVTYQTFDGATANLADRVGRPLVVNFFARWCVACVSEMPDLEAVHQQVADEIDVIGISEDADPADALDLVAETGVTYDLGWDPDGTVFAHFGGFAMPTTVLVAADGTVVDVFSGAVTAAELTDRLEAIRS